MSVIRYKFQTQQSDSLRSNEVKAGKRLVGAALVSQADAFDEHHKAVVVVEVAATLLAGPIELRHLRQCRVHAVQHGVEKTLSARNHREDVPHVHNLLPSTVHVSVSRLTLSTKTWTAFLAITSFICSVLLISQPWLID